MPISPSGFPALTELSNGERAESLVFNRPLFALSTRTESLRTLLELVEQEVTDARGTYSTLEERLDSMFGDTFSDRNIFLTGGSATWNAGSSTFTYSQILLVQPDKSFNYVINSGSMSSIADGDSLYVVLSRNSMAPTLTLIRVASGAVPSSKDAFVIAVRYGDRLWLRNNGEFEDNETREMGDGMTTALLGRLGMSDESDTATHYTNTTIMPAASTIPAALSAHDLNIEYLIRDRNVILGGGGSVGWSITGPNGSFSFDASFSVIVPAVGTVTISPTTIGSIVDGDVLYITYTRSGTSYPATLVRVAYGSLPLSFGNTDNLVLGVRKGSTFILRTGEVFQDGEVKPLGAGGGGLVTYQNMSLFPSSDDDVTWNATLGQITCPGDITIHFPWESYGNTIPSTEFPITLSASGRKAYVVLNRDAATNLTVIEDVTTIPITYSQADVLLVAERVGNAVYMFGTHRYNDGDIRRIGEGFVAGEIYDEVEVITNPLGEASVTLPGGESHAGDGKVLKVWANGILINPGAEYTEGPLATEITCNTCDMFPDGKFPQDCKLRFRIESIVTGGAGPGGGGGGIAWSDPVDANIIPDTDNVRYVGSGIKGFKALYLSDRIGNGDVYEIYIQSGSFQAVLI